MPRGWTVPAMLVATSAVLSTACGGHSIATDDEGRTEQGACRAFASRYEYQGDVTECQFDRAELRMRCEPTLLGVWTTRWSSIEDALRENTPIGRITAASRSYVSDEVTFTDTISYDDAGRPTLSQAGVIDTSPTENRAHAHESREFLAWDVQRRPTRARVTTVWSGAPPPMPCTVGDETFEYDDENRRITWRRPTADTPLCLPVNSVSTYDEDGILVSVWSEQIGTTSSVTVLERGRICLDD